MKTKIYTPQKRTPVIFHSISFQFKKAT